MKLIISRILIASLVMSFVGTSIAETTIKTEQQVEQKSESDKYKVNQSANSDLDGLYNEEQVNAIISLAFETKSTRYTEFARLFNRCQKQPNHPDCGDSYTAKRTQYEIAKANHAVLQMVYKDEFKYLLMPEVNSPELVVSLQSLGYLNSRSGEDVSYEDTLTALNHWLSANRMRETRDIYLLHALLVRAEELSQRLLNEQEGA
ncbi:hypothetical protein [Vibrio sp. 99-70-13A1]|uniref:hypothetical protein n=1 Tax=Vibrio sp. 99-70-13A1 TaxID=2607601 RepID=UPI001493D2BC|nr:hypothetical protein [Vibrio sp. 99-70-13A1]NOH98219.1 hypothetical protein [Vibrio sp. 99-70-13A1]